jgi:hypothetical protein
MVAEEVSVDKMFKFVWTLTGGKKKTKKKHTLRKSDENR